MDLDKISPKINFNNLYKSQKFYKKNNFKIIEVPWFVNKKSYEYTCKIKNLKNKYKIKFNNKKYYFVGSREQSFIYLSLKNKIKKGLYQSITPRFRDDKIDDTHKNYFIKNELFISKNVNKKHLKKVIKLSFKFYSKIFNKKDIKIIKTKDKISIISYDIYYKNIELGSYGIRKIKKLKWIYGTGCREPRTSFCKNK